MDVVLETAPVEEIDGIDLWWERHARAGPGSPIERAVSVGASMDRIAYAFASGYQEALRALFQRGEGEGVAALAVTEEGGNHPRAIECALSEGLLVGKKKWATLTPPAEEIYVAARRGVKEDGRPDIVLVRVGVDADGVEVNPGPPTPFAPEVSHASLVFERVHVADDDVLPGDGYGDYVKPFRTVEDIFVHAAVFAHLTRAGCVMGWEPSLLERMMAVVAALMQLAEADPKSVATHVALAGVLSTSKALLDEIDHAAASSDATWRYRYERDRPLFNVAQGARDRRRTVAWERIRQRVS